MGPLKPIWSRIGPGSPAYPRRLVAATDTPPPTLTVLGEAGLLHLPNVALFCSRTVPADLILRTLDLARSLRDSGAPVICGFQSLLEQECLRILIRGEQPVLICPARGVDRMRIRGEWQQGMAQGRVAIVSALPERCRRASVTAAEARNTLLLALASRTIVVQAQPGSRSWRVAAAALHSGHPVYCLDHPRNRDLLLLGARLWP